MCFFICCHMKKSDASFSQTLVQKIVANKSEKVPNQNRFKDHGTDNNELLAYAELIL